MKKVTAAFIFIVLMFSNLIAGEICVTGVRQIDGTGRVEYEITLNNAIVIRDITIAGSGNKRFLEFPEYISQKKRRYPQVIFKTIKTIQDVRTAVLSNTFESGRFCVTRYKIVEFSLFRKKSAMKALAAVSFNDEIEIECKVIENGDAPWVSWPSRKLSKDGGWYRQVIITDTKLRETVEKDLLSRYRKEISNIKNQ